MRGECKTSFHDYFTKPQSFYAKSVELEVIFNSCWVLEIQNAAFTNQSGASTNHIGRFGGLDVILQRRYGQVRG